jgi:hypothetical protein
MEAFQWFWELNGLTQFLIIASCVILVLVVMMVRAPFLEEDVQDEHTEIDRMRG